MVGAIEQVLSALNAARVRYLVVGGVAVVLHGHLRATADLDLVVQLGPENALEAVRTHRFAGLEVDLFVSEPLDFDAAYARAVHVQLASTVATVVCIEDLLALKKAAGRPVDLADIEALQALVEKDG
jgi:predicted nucleotidyltransferase